MPFDFPGPMTNAQSIIRPKLTMPPTEADALRAAYAMADVILEYGSGGSTLLAAEMPGKTVTSVESDRDWVQMMQDWFEHAPPAAGSKAEILWADIGATKEWGHPKSRKGWRRYAGYPLGVWSRVGFVQPDVVLVDGRFRTGCALASAFNTAKPVKLLFDDYKPRKHYHRIEEFLGRPGQMHGRMAEFEVKPMPVPAERLLQVIEMMTQP